MCLSSCSVFISWVCHCYVCLGSGGAHLTIICKFLVTDGLFFYSVALFLFLFAGFQCLSLLLLPPCPSWLHRYLWLALLPECRRAVSEEAKTYFPPYLCQLFPFLHHPACIVLVHPLPSVCWFQLILISCYNWLFQIVSHYWVLWLFK